MILAAALAVTIAFQAPPFEEDIKKFEAEDAKHPPAKGGIVVIGSSSVGRWTTLQQDFPGYNMIRRGFGGSEISDSVRYAQRIVTPYEPQMVVLWAGTNDIAAGKSGDVVFKDYKAFVGKVREKLPKVPIVYISISPAPSRWKFAAEMRKANDQIKDYCEKSRGGLIFVNTFPKMLNEKGEPREELFVEDRLHPNEKGYALVKEMLAPVLPKKHEHLSLAQGFRIAR